MDCYIIYGCKCLYDYALRMAGTYIGQKAIDEKNRKILDPEYAYNQIQKVASNDKKGERTMDVINEAVKSYQKDNTQKLFDPNNLVENMWVDKKIDELTALKDNFHSVVTKANTSIIVEVELED